MAVMMKPTVVIKTAAQLEPGDLIEIKGKVHMVTTAALGTTAVRRASYGHITNRVTISVTEPLYKVRKGIVKRIGDGHMSVPATFKVNARFTLLDPEVVVGA